MALLDREMDTSDDEDDDDEEDDEEGWEDMRYILKISSRFLLSSF